MLTVSDETELDGDPPKERRERPELVADESQEQHRDAARVIDSDEIFDGHREVWIRHCDQMYRLRCTRSGKLYLTK